MPVDLATTPFLDNYPITRQLWMSPARNPSNELKLVPTNRNLTVRFRDILGTLVLVSSELLTLPMITIVNSDRGVVSVTVSGTAWAILKQGMTYTCEIVAYGALVDSFQFFDGLPNPHEELLSGCEIYASPRLLYELVGSLPGAQVETFVALNGGWTKNTEGYWIRFVDASVQLHGLWINDQHARQVDYADLALGCDRQWARVGDTIYYKGSETLSGSSYPVHVETAFSHRTWENLKEATAECDRRTGRTFAKTRYFRETHRGLSGSTQITLRNKPAVVDDFFRLDGFSRTRSLIRRYTEDSLLVQEDLPLYATANPEAGRLNLNAETGVITLSQGFFDWTDWGGTLTFGGMSTFPSGDVALEVTYTAGRDRIPVDIQGACAYLAAIKQLLYWQMAMSQGSNSISIGCVSMSFSNSNQYTDPWKQAAEEIIGSYQNILIEAF